ncbi:hypothetical protein PM082_005044 [Marasmius tenuissimus]|nr:hypothetical protein PM082_005044 [Marasmius tenuissimus]
MCSVFWDYLSNRGDGQSVESPADQLSEGRYGLYYASSISPSAPIACSEDRSFSGHHPASENLTMEASASQTFTLEEDPQPCPRPCCDGVADSQSPQSSQTPLGQYSETFFQPYDQVYSFTPCYASLPAPSQSIPSIDSSDYLYEYVHESYTPFSFQHHSPTVPMSPVSNVADGGHQAVIAPHSPIVVQSPILETLDGPSTSSNAAVERSPGRPRVVGSMAHTLVARSLRKKRPKYFCDVPGCQSQGFTQKHNFECKSYREIFRQARAVALT